MGDSYSSGALGWALCWICSYQIKGADLRLPGPAGGRAGRDKPGGEPRGAGGSGGSPWLQTGCGGVQQSHATRGKQTLLRALPGSRGALPYFGFIFKILLFSRFGSSPLRPHFSARNFLRCSFPRTNPLVLLFVCVFSFFFPFSFPLRFPFSLW